MLFLSEDKLGGHLVHARQLYELYTFVSDCGFMPLDDHGSRFSWSNKRNGLNSVMKKLDRDFVNAKFQDMFPGLPVRYLPTLKSDHKPILWDLLPVSKKVSYPFKFHAM